MLASSNAFVITQFGLSAFIWDGSSSAWRPKTFNFYTFPRPFEDWQPRFLCEAASMDFLATCNFDFNKWVHGGIAYMPGRTKLDSLIYLFWVTLFYSKIKNAPFWI